MEKFEAELRENEMRLEISKSKLNIWEYHSHQIWGSVGMWSKLNGVSDVGFETCELEASKHILGWPYSFFLHRVMQFIS